MIRGIIVGIVCCALITVMLYMVGFRVVTPNGRVLSSRATTAGGGHSGWRRREAQLGGDSGYPRHGGRQYAQDGGATPEGGPGSGRGGGRGYGGRSKTAQQGQVSGFGPSGGILLPIKIGSTTIPVMTAGKTSSSFIGQDLVNHVEDTVIATSEGPRKGWSIDKTLKYLGIQNYKTIVLVLADGRTTTMTPQQLQDPQTIPLFTYDEQGQLMAVSGPKVRGANRGNITIDDVKNIVAGRTDLLHLTNITKIEVKG
jgi:hypothetical protein